MNKKHRSYFYVEIKVDKNLVIIIKHYIKVSSWPVSLKPMVLVMIKHHIKILKQSILQAYWRNCHSSQRWMSIKMM